jgi:hypothetical protein
VRPCVQRSETIRRGGVPGQVEGPDPHSGSAQMAAKKQKAKDKKPLPSARSRSSLGSAVIGTTFNMAATLATFASVLLCLIVAKHFT